MKPAEVFAFSIFVTRYNFRDSAENKQGENGLRVFIVYFYLRYANVGLTV